MEEEEIVITESDACYPVLLIPKSCTTLETNCAATDNVFIKLNITTIDTQGNEPTIYSGYCNVKIIDCYDFDHNKIKTDSNLSDSDNVLGEVTLMDTNDPCYNDNQTEMLIDPTNNPYVSNNYCAQEAEESYSLYQAHREHIAVRQHNTYITQNVYEAIHYSPVSEFEHKKFGRVQMIDDTNQQPSIDEELECGMILSQLPEEILLANQNKAREEMRYVDLPSDNDAIKQLMSSDLQKQPRQQRTILYLGDSSHRGHTVQKITINDPQVECVQGSPDSELVVVDETPREKKYQCEKCDQIFYQIQAFRQHIQVKHTAGGSGPWPPASAPELACRECGKRFKTREKHELHRLGHGDPDLECPQCRKVFASKMTLKNHAKIHDRKHECRYCTRTYRKAKDLGSHLAKIHSVYKCEECEFSTHKCEELEGHVRGHGHGRGHGGTRGSTRSDSETTASLDAWTDAVTAGAEYAVTYEPRPTTRRRRHDPDSVIARVISNKVFLLNSKRAARLVKKRCNICHKTFDRVSDLKRHLIEHILRSSLAKDPVDDSGTLAIRCEVCHAHTFTRVDRYKAHLREHAKLTIYKCTFCDKTFSDSSNFSKHKKIHSTKFFQCDLCRRKFSSRKTIIEHLQYHGRNGPVRCPYCAAEFHFPSVLKKHMKLAHTRKPNRSNCKFCGDSFKTLKDKWDHEWKVHNVRKMIVDCLICGSKFRKYSDLKAHCTALHDIQIPPARRLLQKRKHRK